MSKQHCRTHPFRTIETQTVTLADLYGAIEDGSAPGWTVVSVADKKELIATIRLIAEMRDGLGAADNLATAEKLCTDVSRLLGALITSLRP